MPKYKVVEGKHCLAKDKTGIKYAHKGDTIDLDEETAAKFPGKFAEVLVPAEGEEMPAPDAEAAEAAAPPKPAAPAAARTTPRTAVRTGPPAKPATATATATQAST